MPHQCPAPDCTRSVPTHQLACRPHWYALPKAIRDRVWSGYQQEPLGDAHLAAISEAIEHLAQQYGAR